MTNRDDVIKVVADAMEGTSERAAWPHDVLDALEAAGLCVIERGSVPEWMRWAGYLPYIEGTTEFQGHLDMTNLPYTDNGGKPAYVVDGDA